MGLLRTGLIGAIGYQMGKKHDNGQQQNSTPPPQQHYYYPPGYQPQMNYMGGPQQYQQQPQPQFQNGYPQQGQPQYQQPQYNQPPYGQPQNRDINVEGSAPPPYVQGAMLANRRDEKSPAAGRNAHQ